LKKNGERRSNTVKKRFESFPKSLEARIAKGIKAIFEEKKITQISPLSSFVERKNTKGGGKDITQFIQPKEGVGFRDRVTSDYDLEKGNEETENSKERKKGDAVSDP